MSMLYKKISENFVFNDVDIPAIINDITQEVSRGQEIIKLEYTHWQYFSDSNIRFSRNLYMHAPKLAINVAKGLLELQRSLLIKDDDCELTRYFLNTRINVKNIELIKVLAGQSVKPHIDKTRNITLNIGMLNSNSCETHVIDTIDPNKQNSSSALSESFIMNDGDVYLLRTQCVHWVNSIDKNRDRYVITYSGIL